MTTLLIAMSVVLMLVLQAVAGYLLIENVKKTEVYKHARLEFVLSDEHLTEKGKVWRQRFLLFHGLFWCSILASIVQHLLS